MAGKFEIKAVVTGAQQSSEELKKVGDAAQQLGQKTEKSSEQVDKITTSKKRWLDALKKLKSDIPAVGVALDIVKNPLTSLTLAFALAANRLAAMNKMFNDLRDAVGNGTIGDQMRNIAEALEEASIAGNKFTRTLDQIKSRAESVEEQVTRLNQSLQRSLKVEAMEDEQAKDAALAGVKDPEARAAIEAQFGARAKKREQRRLAGEANIQAQAQFRAQDIVREGEAGLPAAKERLARAAMRRDQLIAMADAAADPAAFKPLLDDIGGSGWWSDIKRFTMFGFSTRNRDETFNTLTDARDFAAGGQGPAARLRKRATADFGIAQEEFDAFQARTTGAAEDVRKFGLARTNAVADAAAMQPFNDPGAIAGNNLTRRLQADADAAAERVGPAFDKAFLKVLRRIEALERGSATQVQQ